MWTVVLLIVAAAAVFTVFKGKLAAWFAKPGEPPQRVVIVSAAGPTLWQRTAGTIVGALLVLVPAMLLLRYTGEHHDPVTNYYAPAATSTTDSPTGAGAGTPPPSKPGAKAIGGEPVAGSTGGRR